MKMYREIIVACHNDQLDHLQGVNLLLQLQNKLFIEKSRNL